MPVNDADVGITEFLGRRRPFRGVLKQTVDDFVVNEILLSGQIARLTQLARSAPPKKNRETPAEQSEPVNVDINKVPFDELNALFPKETPASSLVRDALLANQKTVTLPTCTDKEMRTRIHAWVRENLPSYVTDTVSSEEGKQAVRMRKRDSCRPWKRRRVNNDQSQSTNTDASKDETYDPREGKAESNRSLRVGPNTYVQFVLWKRNRDTTDAVSVLGKILRVPANAFTYAGTKDKRAVTTQIVQVKGISESRFAHANRVLTNRDTGSRSIAIGNVEPVRRRNSRPLGLGDLRGNKFVIALRDLELGTDGDTSIVLSAVEGLRNRGFVNYFGLQRFGSGVSPTHETGFAALRGDFEDVCRRILLPLRVKDDREGMRPDRQRFVSAMDKFARREITATELLEELPQRMYIERTIVGSFVDDEKRGISKYDYKKAFARLPRNLKRIYGHAVQSFLWNMMASERIRRVHSEQEGGLFALEGDIVPTSDKAIRHFHYETSVRSVTEEEATEKSIPMHRVLIPVLGSDVGFPDSDYAQSAKQILAEQQIDLKSKLILEFGMRGTYRPLLAKPCDVEARIITYQDRSAQLIPSEVDDLFNDDVTATNEGNGKIQSANVGNPEVNPGSAAEGSQRVKGLDAKVDSGVGDSYVQSTSIAENGLSSHAEREGAKARVLQVETDHGGNALEQGNGHAKTSAEDLHTEQQSEAEKHALVLSFTLGCAEYATMLVRELTGQDSSTANQKALQESVREPGAQEVEKEAP